jgi:hypothetical protein
MQAQVGALREVLAQQSVGVLVRPALPRAVRLLYWALGVKPSGYAGQAVVPLAGSVLLSEVDPVAAS